MKKKKIKIIITGFAAMLCSCSILDIEPTSEWGGADVPTEQSHIEGILMGGYERLGAALLQGFVYYGDARADVYYTNSPTATNLDKVVRSNLDVRVSQSSWLGLYQVVKQANLNIYHIPRMIGEGTLEAADVNDLLGQAYCQRAMAYYWIVRIWGEAPLITKPVFTANDEFDMPRSPVDDVLAMIHQDLENAESLLTPPTSSKYVKKSTTFSYPASRALRAHVYMWQKDYDNALTELDYVIGQGGYTLEGLYDASVSVSDNTAARTNMAKTGFSRMFNSQQTSGSTESIFELSFSTSDGDTNNAFDSFWTANTCQLVVREDMAAFMKENSQDRRYYASVKAASGGKYRHAKFVMDYTKGDARNIILIRLADMLLLRAEANLALIGDPNLTATEAKAVMSDLNAIRVRAIGPTGEIPYEGVEGTNGWEKSDFVSLMKSERRKELAFEGQRWFDLVRWGEVNEALMSMEEAKNASYVFDTGPHRINVENGGELWPIHINEIRRSRYIEQNEYYK